MALPAPNLDDRRFQQLVDDAKRLVQRNCPEWTDHNVSDPGDQTILYIDVQYALKGTNDKRNLVFPFYTIPDEATSY